MKGKAGGQQALKSDMLLLLTAAIWGFAFVAQRMGMDYMGPFAFNGVRFLLGGLVLVPFIILFSGKKQRGKPGRRTKPGKRSKQSKRSKRKLIIWGSALAGTLVFLGASFQQVGLVYTTAGNAGFVTGLYMIFVPIFGLAIGQTTNRGTWLGAAIALVGLYFLSVGDNFQVSWGDMLVFIGALFWAVQVLWIGYLSPKIDSLKLAFTEFMVCALLSLLVAIAIETITWSMIEAAAIPLLYGGLASVGIAYTIQVFVQKKAHPAHAAIIMGMEAVFAVIGGFLFLGEVLPARGILGCSLMLAGMFVSQLWGIGKVRGSGGMD